MLAEMMETSNADFPNPSLLSKKLSSMYGAIFGTNVLKYGNQHVLRIILSVVNEKYLPSYKSVLHAGIKFLHSVIFNPQIVANRCFNQDIFKRQQNNMISYLNSLNDDKQFYSTMQLRKIYYTNEKNHRGFLLGTPNQIQTVNSEELYHYYLNTINQNNIKINVLGDVDAEEILNQFKQFHFKPRRTNSGEIVFHPKLNHHIQNRSQILNINQGKLSIGYHLPVYLNDKYYYAALMFNALFGGTPQSKLFLNIREKHSLAYYADSIYNALTGTLLVESGIDAKNEKRVIKLIDQQLLDIQRGNFSDKMIRNAKADLINEKISSLDDPKYLLEQYAILSNIGKIPNIDRWCNQINRITKFDIMKIAQSLNLKATFFLGKED